MILLFLIIYIDVYNLSLTPVKTQGVFILLPLEEKSGLFFLLHPHKLFQVLVPKHCLLNTLREGNGLFPA